MAVPLSVTDALKLVFGAASTGLVRSIRTVAAAAAIAGPGTFEASRTLAALRVKASVPSEQPETETAQVVGPPVGASTTQLVAVPDRVRSAAVRPLTSLAKVTW